MLGNRVLNWNSYQEILSSGWRGGGCMRSIRGVARKAAEYDIPFSDVKEAIKRWKINGIDEWQIKFNQSMPNDEIVIQGEIIDLAGPEAGALQASCSLLYSNVKKPMNLALAEEQKQAHGLTALMLLKANMDASSLDDIAAIFQMFPETTIEFTTYSINVGIIPHRNTVIWEVRSY